MANLMQPAPPAPRIKLRRRRRLRCLMGNHDLTKRRVYIPGSRWKTQMLYCRRCNHIEDVRAFKDHE